MGRELVAATFVVAAAAAAAAAAEPVEARIDCQPVGGGPVYDCTITLVEPSTGAPVPDARLTVRADMPSMPMAHNFRPVEAAPAGAPGTYRARLALDMYGTWAVTLHVSEPVQAEIGRRLDFFE